MATMVPHREPVRSTIITRPRMGPSLGFMTNVFFFSVDLCYILWSVLLHYLICIAPLVEINCTIGVVLRQCFSILFEFQVIRKGCVFSPFFAICPFISSLLLHSFSNYIVALRDDR